MLVLNSPQVVQETTLRWRKESKIALVPTMGCLHEGHLQLVRRAKEFADKVVVSIFVNPLQFGPGEDFDKYPRTFDDDVQLLEKEGVDLVFHPSVTDLYPQGFSTTVSLGDITKRLCGGYRPGHFDGVSTVCLKLFEITQCNFAVFGEKDFQQLRIIQNMAVDLNLPLTIVAQETVRESDGLAMSSRNRYLSEEERKAASLVPQILFSAKELVVTNGSTRVKDIYQMAERMIATTSLKAQYVQVTQTRLLLPAEPEDVIHGLPSPHLFVAIHAGKTRLIDNLSLNGIHR